MPLSRAINLPYRMLPPFARLLLNRLKRLQHGSLQLHTPEGDTLRLGQHGAAPEAELTVHDWSACRKLLLSGDIGFAEAYRDGLVDSPDLTALLRLALRNEAALRTTLSGSLPARWWYALKHYLRRNSKSGSRRNIHAHYDLGNAFYQLWLDSSWTYSSAWFNGDCSQPLSQAQAAKYQRICDVLQLRPGMRVLEIGCGWGGFAEHAARQGIAVHGITLSEAQLAFAQQRLAGYPQVTLALQDYRDLSGQYDAIVSIEMFEAVGEAYWRDYFHTLQRLLKPGAQALVQSITIDDRHYDRYRSRSDFIQEFIFPGGMLPSCKRFESTAAQCGLQTLNRLDFGPDYAETLRRWREGFEHTLLATRQLGFDEAFIRIWRLYYCYCEAGFDEGRTGVSQFLLQAQPA